MRRKSERGAKKQPAKAKEGLVRPAPTCHFQCKVCDIGLHHLCRDAECKCKWPRDWNREES